MHIAVIIDVILAVVLLACLLWGAYRGLFLSLAGLLVLIVSLVGAGFMASHLAKPVSDAMRPMVETYITNRVDAALTGEVTPEIPEAGQDTPQTALPETEQEEPSLPDMGIPEDLSVAEQAQRILEALGLGDRVREDLAQRVEETVRDTSVSVVSAVADNLLQSVVHTVLFLLTFAVLTLVLRLVVKLLSMVLKLPGLHLLNTIGGALLGLAQGTLLLLVVFWALDRFGLCFSAQTIGDTWILQFFVTNGPLGFLSSL